MKATVLANAKINLFLDILGKRDDGYHYVNMIMQSINLYDTINLKIVPHNDISISGNCNFNIPREDNTIYKAAKLFLSSQGITNYGIEAAIIKKIPVCAGLAGGSADAAATLVGLNNLFNAHLSTTELIKLGEKIGTDVPFCILGGTMLAGGIGMELTKVSSFPNCHIVVVKPNIDISTGYAYKQSDKIQNKKNNNIQAIISALKSKNIKAISSEMFNFFEKIVEIPEVKEIKTQMETCKSIGASMSGSGPTVFGLFNQMSDAETCANLLNKKYHQTFLCHPSPVGCIIT